MDGQGDGESLADAADCTAERDWCISSIDGSESEKATLSTKANYFSVQGHFWLQLINIIYWQK